MSAVITVNLNSLPLLEGWYDHDPAVRQRVAFPLFAATGTATTSAVYFELDPGKALGMHTDSAEEILLVLDGTVEATVGAETGQAGRGELVLIPEMVPHSVRNVGQGVARCLGFFSAARVVSTFDQPIMPLGQRVAGAPPIESPQGPLTWSQVVQMLGLPPQG